MGGTGNVFGTVPFPAGHVFSRQQATAEKGPHNAVTAPTEDTSDIYRRPPGPAGTAIPTGQVVGPAVSLTVKCRTFRVKRAVS